MIYRSTIVTTTIACLVAFAAPARADLTSPERPVGETGQIFASADDAARARDADLAPEWVKALRGRPLSHYFPLGTISAAGHARAQQMLRDDLTKLHLYFERDSDDPDLERATARALDRFVAKLTYARVMHGRVGALKALHELTLERVVADAAARAALRARHPWQKIEALLGITHLRGATESGSLQILSQLVRWIGRQFTPDRDIHWKNVKPVLVVLAPVAGAGMLVDHFTQSHLVTGFVLGSAWGAVQAGPIAHLISASTSWFLTPTTEYVKIWTARRTGDAEQRIQTAFNKVNTKISGETTMDQMRAATLERDNSNIAGMSPRMQMRGFNRGRAIFLALKNSFQRLLNHTEHHGRWLLTGLWSDEIDTINLVHQGLGQISDIDSAVKGLLTPYRTKLVLDGDYAANARVAEQYAGLVRALEKHDWLRDELSPALEARVDEFIAAMRGIHLPEIEIQEIMTLQRRRSMLINSVVTGLAVNEARYLFFPEANRNMPDEPREIQRAIRANLRLQHYVTYFEPEIQAIHREMGIRIEDDCEELLDAA